MSSKSIPPFPKAYSSDLELLSGTAHWMLVYLDFPRLITVCDRLIYMNISPHSTWLTVSYYINLLTMNDSSLFKPSCNTSCPETMFSYSVSSSVLRSLHHWHSCCNHFRRSQQGAGQKFLNFTVFVAQEEGKWSFSNLSLHDLTALGRFISWSYKSDPALTVTIISLTFLPM